MRRRNVFALLALLVIGSMPAAFAAPFTAYTAETFDKALQGKGSIVVHVHADWCPTCRAQAPTLQSMTTDPAYADVRFIRVNFDKDRDFLVRYKVTYQSALIVFKDGKEVTRFVSVTDPSQIRSRIKSAI